MQEHLGLEEHVDLQENQVRIFILTYNNMHMYVYDYKLHTCAKHGS